MGPEGGEEGGLAIAVGTPEEVAADPSSHTGQFLAEILTPTVARADGAAAKRSRARKTPKVAA
jgi:excinuclease ABC subunit A